MNYGIFTWGTRGDVQPFISLTLGLMEQGHQVTLFAPENFKLLIEEYGIVFSPLHGNVDDILHSAEGLRVLKSGNAISLLRLMQKEGKKVQPLVNRDLLLGCEKVDVIITSVLCQVWISCIAEKLNKKWGGITFSPPTTPTKKFPFAGFAFLNNAKFNWFSHRLFEYLYWTLNKKEINKFRLSISLPVLKSNILDRITKNNILNLYAISPSLIPRPDDWTSNSDITGYLFLLAKERENHQTDKVLNELLEFLKKGEPPVYIGMGSMPIPNKDLFENTIREILESTNNRIIFCKGWSKIPNLPQHNNLFIIDYINHDWLLPQCKVAIIHGGAGTIATVLKAKVPMIIASVVGDQPWWGKIIQDKSLGLHIPFKKLNSKRLIEAIDKVQSNQIKTNLNNISEKIIHENGTKTAIDSIIEYFEMQ